MVVSRNRVPITELEPLAEEMPAGVTWPPRMIQQQDPDESLIEDYSTTMHGDDTMMGNTDAGIGGAQQPGRHPDQPQHSDLATSIPGNSDTMWRYIEPMLKRTSSRADIQKSYMHMFFELPRKREIHWNASWIAQNPFLDSQPRDIASLVVHVTGDYAEVPCNHCKLGKGPYSGCVIVSGEAPPGLVVAFDSCANCLYHCGHAYCSLKTTFRPRFAKLYPDINFDMTRRYVRSGMYRKALARGGVPEAAKSLKVFAQEQEDHAAAVRAARDLARRHHRKYEEVPRQTSKKIELSVSAAERIRVERQVRTELQRRSDRIAVKDGMDSEAPPVQRRTTAIPVPVPGLANGLAAQNSPLIFAGAAQPGPDVLEMEDWEVAPGRVESGAASTYSIPPSVFASVICTQC